MIDTRQLQATDFEAIGSFAQSAEELFYIAPSASYPWRADKFAEAIAERLSNTVFTDFGAIVGFANFYDLEPGEKAFIGNVIVNPSFRRQGLGRHILQHMMELAFTEHHFREVHLSCFSSNTPALLLYRKLGFKSYGIEQRTDYKNESVALVNFKLSADQYRETESGLDLDQVSAKLADI